MDNQVEYTKKCIKSIRNFLSLFGKSKRPLSSDSNAGMRSNTPKVSDYVIDPTCDILGFVFRDFAGEHFQRGPIRILDAGSYGLNGMYKEILY